MGNSEIKTENAQKYYYLLNGKIYCTYKEMPTNKIFDAAISRAAKYDNWHTSLQPCEITEDELDKLLVNLFGLVKEHLFELTEEEQKIYSKPINVTDLVNDDNGVVRFRERSSLDTKKKLYKKYNEGYCDAAKHYKHPKQVNESLQDIIWQKFYDEVKPLLEKYNLNNIDSCFLMKVISEAGYAPPVKQVDEASEAFEFKITDIAFTVNEDHAIFTIQKRYSYSKVEHFNIGDTITVSRKK